MLATALATATLTACGGGDVAVVAALEGQGEGAEPVALANLPVRLLPYDRDVLFDSLTQAYPEPEPRMPDSLVALQGQVAERQQAWRTAEQRWGMLRDSLKTISDRMTGMDQSTGEYFVLFQTFGELEDEVGQLEQASQAAFRQFESLQRRLTQQSREIRLAHQAWADEAFASVDSIIDARLEEMGLVELADTTDAQGVARFNGVDGGQWWVHARFDRPFDELYWNEPIEVTGGGEPLVIRLSRENAEVRQKM